MKCKGEALADLPWGILQLGKSQVSDPPSLYRMTQPVDHFIFREVSFFAEVGDFPFNLGGVAPDVQGSVGSTARIKSNR